MAGDDLGHHLTLGHGAVRQHRLAGHVADGIDSAHGRLAFLIDTNERSFHIEHQLFQSPALRDRPAADRDEDLVGRQGRFRTILRLDQQCTARLRQAARLGAGHHVDAEGFQSLGDGPGQFGIVLRQDTLLSLDDADLRAHLGEGGPELEADITASDDDEAVRHGGQRQRLG